MRFFTIASLAAALSVAGNTFASPIAAPENHVVEKTANVDKRADPWYGPCIYACEETQKNTPGLPTIWLEYCFMHCAELYL
ncbi:hypothetical protein CGCSCA4_v007689 [Colletotrichum siamense]|uniref:Uncharacterized protein n=1 Tax=Colletotrichum siamense TaxID=690259 RepID=A0A9P5EQN8_COLSI|nr:hypothetical protein CGCSCA4_v007689 [Colletotrichum siamense]KAF4857818.1 hypothetical protein CGCSCA2_v007940 [Colletotrichum siamense]